MLYEWTRLTPPDLFCQRDIPLSFLLLGPRFSKLLYHFKYNNIYKMPNETILIHKGYYTIYNGPGWSPSSPGREECTGVAPYWWPLYILPINILIYLLRTYTMLLQYSILKHSVFSHNALYHSLFYYLDTRFSILFTDF